MRQAIFDLGAQWAANPARPRIPEQTLSAWTQLIADWVKDTRLPLLVRKTQADRGACIIGSEGRTLVPTDNSPAQWAFAFAYTGRCPHVDEVISLLERGEIPIAMALKTHEREHAVYKDVRSRCLGTSDNGWKLAHIDGVALGGRGRIETYPFSVIAAHFARFMSPKNMLVVPAEFSGLTEVSAFIEGYCSAMVIRSSDSSGSNQIPDGIARKTR